MPITGFRDIATFTRDFEACKVRAACICGGSRGLPVMRKDRYDLEILPWLCLHCGHVYARFQFSEKDLKDFYSLAYRSLYGGANYLASQEARRSRIAAARKHILGAFKSLYPRGAGRLVVEWGCGAGWNLVPFREDGIACLGFDLDADYIRFGRSEFGLDLHLMEDLETPPSVAGRPLDGAADLLVINHVLEHTAEPLAMLVRAARLVKEGGHIYVGLPFLENIPTWGFRPYFHIAHLHYFSIPTFVDLAARAGFETAAVDREAGFVVLRRAPARAGGYPRHRLHNSALVLKYALEDMLIVRPRRTVIGFVKRIPVLERLLRRLKGP